MKLCYFCSSNNASAFTHVYEVFYIENVMKKIANTFGANFWHSPRYINLCLVFYNNLSIVALSDPHPYHVFFAWYTHLDIFCINMSETRRRILPVY